MGNLSAAQQLQQFLKANKKESRAKRPGQQPPRNIGRPSKRIDRENVIEDEDLIGLGLEELAADVACSDHGQRVQQMAQRFRDCRPANIERLQQYEAKQEPEDQMRELQARLDGVNERILSALQLHPCHTVVDAAAVDTTAQISRRRTVAWHELGFSCWVEMPTFACLACGVEQEVTPAEVGCFGNTPVSPGVWFTKRLLKMYMQLVFGDGTSSSTFADACKVAAALIDATSAATVSLAPAGQPAVPTINPRCWGGSRIGAGA